MTLTDAERERYGKIAFTTYAQREGELGRFLFNWNSCGDQFHERWGDLAAAVVAARDQDRTAALRAQVVAWRDAAADALAEEAVYAFNMMIAWLLDGGGTDARG